MIRLRLFRAITWLLVISLSLFIIPVGFVKAAPVTTVPAFILDTGLEDSAKLDKVAENDRLVLYANTSNGVIALLDKLTGFIWRSNPKDRDQDSIAIGIPRMNLSAQLLISYADVQMRETQINTFTGSVNRDGVSTELIPNGIRYNFLFPREDMLVPVQYTLMDDHLKAEILTNEIEENGTGRIMRMTLLPLFGAGNQSANGYMMVPDGSGALIYYNNNKHLYNEYNEVVYGFNPSLGRLRIPQPTQTVRLPVFGVKNNAGAFLAVINESDAAASIRATVAGRPSSYNTVHAQMLYRSVEQPYNLFGEHDDGSHEFVVISPLITSNTFEIRYYPLENNNANYSGMAMKYQQYLIKEKGMTKSTTASSELPFFLTLYGAVEKQKQILGIPWKVVEPLTTFKDAEVILQSMKDLGVNKIALRYFGFMKGGIYGKIPTKITYERKLGGRRGFNNLVDFSEANNITIYPVADFNNLYKNGNGIFKFFHSAKSIIESPVYQYLYRLNNRLRDKNFRWNILNPLQVKGVAEKFLKSLDRIRLSTVAVSMLPDVVYSDFSRKKTGVNRVQSMNIWVDVLNLLKDNTQSVMSGQTNAYAFPYVDYIVNTPMTSSYFDITDESIPFYQMVLSGYKTYATPPLNLSSITDEMFLKGIETGAAVHYTWIGQDPSLLTSTPLDHLYSTDYKSWLQKATDQYHELNTVMEYIGGARIINHTRLQDGVYQTSYDNGVKVIVNYNDRNIRTSGTTVNAKGYLLIGGK